MVEKRKFYREFSLINETLITNFMAKILFYSFEGCVTKNKVQKAADLPVDCGFFLLTGGFPIPRILTMNQFLSGFEIGILGIELNLNYVLKTKGEIEPDKSRYVSARGRSEPLKTGSVREPANLTPA